MTRALRIQAMLATQQNVGSHQMTPDFYKGISLSAIGKMLRHFGAARLKKKWGQSKAQHAAPDPESCCHALWRSGA